MHNIRKNDHRSSITVPAASHHQQRIINNSSTNNKIAHQQLTTSIKPAATAWIWNEEKDWSIRNNSLKPVYDREVWTLANLPKILFPAKPISHSCYPALQAKIIHNNTYCSIINSPPALILIIIIQKNARKERQEKETRLPYEPRRSFHYPPCKSDHSTFFWKRQHWTSLFAQEKSLRSPRASLKLLFMPALTTHKQPKKSGHLLLPQHRLLKHTSAQKHQQHRCTASDRPT